MPDERAKSKRRTSDKLFAEWFWADRWTTSRGHTLEMEARGLYREMLTQAWMLGAKLPNDHEQIRLLCACSLKVWKRCWPKVAPFWIEDPGDAAQLVNVTQVVVYLDAKAAADKASTRGAAGGHASAKAATERRESAHLSVHTRVTHVATQAPTYVTPSVSVSDPISVKNTEIARSPAREAEAFDGDAFMTAFRSGWKSLYGFECSLILKPLQFSELQQQLSAVPPERLTPALAAFFGTTDPYVLKAKHPLGLFLRDPLRFLATPIVAAAVPDTSVDRVRALLNEAR